MEVGPIRPTGIDTDVRAERTRGAHERFAANQGEGKKPENQKSDANTRLSREVDEVELSDEGQRLARRDEADEANRNE